MLPGAMFPNKGKERSGSTIESIAEEKEHLERLAEESSESGSDDDNAKIMLGSGASILDNTAGTIGAWFPQINLTYITASWGGSLQGSLGYSSNSNQFRQTSSTNNLIQASVNSGLPTPTKAVIKFVNAYSSPSNSGLPIEYSSEISGEIAISKFLLI